MSLLAPSSPHAHRPLSTSHVMAQVSLATLPALGVLTWLFGWGSLINVMLAVTTAIFAEALILKLRKRPWRILMDNSALLTGLLLGLSITPLAPWWLPVLGAAVAVVVAKQVYGGLGQNPFNPAMVAYALLLVSFPLPMSLWPQPLSLQAEPWTFWEHLTHTFTGSLHAIDGYTGATLLDAFKHKGALTAEEFWLQTPVAQAVLNATTGVSLAYLLGGVYLLWRGIISWHTPVAVLASLLILAAFFYGADPSQYASPSMHLLVGAGIFSAFFIATDPVTSATSHKGKLVYGAGIGILVYVIRTWGNYPDAFAFAVLLMNFAVPFIDYYTRPRTYGHARAQRGIK
ncbi:electron transport complex protein RnfD [Allopseudospirillum japonicum]|uniref:Ion-translocating oxidoreductase complex subunit D n=1 Tax=Allopseudospirillum japonicum TaxID=64971 RepID=A0A1H6Q331_9GAMM|nr:RnfABCDGE type electron transport complex subunit D [Allopseudospirillum japonicum]SEI38251.1 electron transport complex protein RnfD [Allopseudospirillum japonicum]